MSHPLNCPNMFLISALSCLIPSNVAWMIASVLCLSPATSDLMSSLSSCLLCSDSSLSDGIPCSPSRLLVSDSPSSCISRRRSDIQESILLLPSDSSICSPFSVSTPCCLMVRLRRHSINCLISSLCANPCCSTPHRSWTTRDSASGAFSPPCFVSAVKIGRPHWLVTFHAPFTAIPNFVDRSASSLFVHGTNAAEYRNNGITHIRTISST
mmetsp:Transcript_5132/g.10314  ORF Transcript_5132/g.10314 Transcript_5132/m.10314 type:complete len:211 (-) Transcript_5132:727-1359(-)